MIDSNSEIVVFCFQKIYFFFLKPSTIHRHKNHILQHPVGTAPSEAR